MRASKHTANGIRSRAFSTSLCLLGFVAIGVGGLWLHIAVLPLPLKSTAGLLARFAYFVFWLACLIYLLGRAFFGVSSQLWHGFVFVLFGIQLGAVGGYLFAGILGCMVGVLSGVILGPLMFAARHRLLSDAQQARTSIRRRR